MRFIKWVVWRPSVKTMTHWFSHEFTIQTSTAVQDRAELPNSPSVPRPQRRDVAFASGESQREVELTTPTPVALRSFFQLELSRWDARTPTLTLMFPPKSTKNLELPQV